VKLKELYPKTQTETVQPESYKCSSFAWTYQNHAATSSLKTNILKPSKQITQLQQH